MRLKAGCEMTLEATEPCPTVGMLRPRSGLAQAVGFPRLEAGATVGMLRPRSGLAQWLTSESYRFDPHVHTTEYVDAYGNLCQRFVTQPTWPSSRASAR
ncbi:MAG: hypothetical protein ACT4QB_02050 [Gammaproteobacteria bacterium]